MAFPLILLFATTWAHASAYEPAIVVEYDHDAIFASDWPALDWVPLAERSDLLTSLETIDLHEAPPLAPAATRAPDAAARRPTEAYLASAVEARSRNFGGATL